MNLFDLWTLKSSMIKIGAQIGWPPPFIIATHSMPLLSQPPNGRAENGWNRSKLNFQWKNCHTVKKCALCVWYICLFAVILSLLLLLCFWKYEKMFTKHMTLTLIDSGNFSTQCTSFTRTNTYWMMLMTEERWLLPNCFQNHIVRELWKAVCIYGIQIRCQTCYEYCLPRTQIHTHTPLCTE